MVLRAHGIPQVQEMPLTQSQSQAQTIQLSRYRMPQCSVSNTTQLLTLTPSLCLSTARSQSSRRALIRRSKMMRAILYPMTRLIFLNLSSSFVVADAHLYVHYGLGIIVVLSVVSGSKVNECSCEGCQGRFDL